MSDAAPAEYVRAHREEPTDLALDPVAVDTSNPPGDTREVVGAIERFLDPLPVAAERLAVDPETRSSNGSDQELDVGLGRVL